MTARLPVADAAFLAVIFFAFTYKNAGGIWHMALQGDALKGKKYVVFFVVINIIGFLGNYFRVPLFYGVDLIFGSIATVMVIKVMGKKWGLATAVIVSSYTYFLWDHPYAIIIFAAEALVLGEFNERRKYNIAFVDAGYWIFAGIPLVVLTYHYVLGMDWTSTVLILLKQSANGVLNVFIASIILYHTPVHRLLPLSFPRSFPLQHILFHLIILSILIPAIAFTVYEGKEEFNRINREIDAGINHALYDVSKTFDIWYEQQLVPLQKLAEELSDGQRHPEETQRRLALLRDSFPSYHNLYIADENGTTIAFFPEVNDNGESTIGLDFSDRLYYKKLKEEMKLYTSDVFMGRGDVFSPIINIGVPIARDEEFNGYVSGALNLDIVQRLLDLTLHDNSINMVVVDREKNIIASTNGLKVMDKYEPGDTEINSDETAYPRTYGQSSSRMMQWKQSSYRGIKMINNGMGWTLIAEVPVSSHQTTLFRRYIKILASTMGILIVALIISHYVCFRIADPLKKLDRLTKKLSSNIGDNDDHLVYENTISRITEIDSLTNNFKAAEEELRNSFIKLNVKQRLLEYLAYHDPHTGLPNAVSAKKHLRDLLSKVKDSRNIFVMVIDIDDFKKINDGFGHYIGDTVLKNMASKLNSICGKDCMAARLSGDGFLLTSGGPGTIEDTERMAVRIIDEFSRPFNIDGLELFVTVSIGISFYPDNGDDAETLIKYADMAMQKTKKAGISSYRFFDFGLVNTIVRNIQIEEGLRKAIDKGQLSVYFQPQKEISSGKLTGVEALLRWRHPIHGYLSPERFIPIAEETGLIIPLGEWVIRTVCNTIKGWLQSGYAVVPVSVNLSLLQLLHGNVAEYIAMCLDKYDIDPGYLRVEITETVGMSSMNKVADNLNRLTAKGIRVVLDDFGKGYSTFSYIQRLPIYEIKIDKDFIDNVDVKHNKAIIEAVIGIAHSLNLKVVAEGVEREDQLDYLRSKNCDAIQGYLFSEAVDRNTLEEKFLEKRV